MLQKLPWMLPHHFSRSCAFTVVISWSCTYQVYNFIRGNFNLIPTALLNFLVDFPLFLVVERLLNFISKVVDFLAENKILEIHQ